MSAWSVTSLEKLRSRRLRGFNFSEEAVFISLELSSQSVTFFSCCW